MKVDVFLYITLSLFPWEKFVKKDFLNISHVTGPCLSHFIEIKGNKLSLFNSSYPNFKQNLVDLIN